MNTTRDRGQAFTTEELRKIEDDALAEGNQLVAQLAEVLLDMERHLEMTAVKVREIGRMIRGTLALLTPFLPDPESLAGNAVERLREFADGFADDAVPSEELRSIHWEHGTEFRVSFKTNWVIHVLAAALADLLRKSDGGLWNNVTTQMHYAGEDYDVTVQRHSGKTVKQQLNEAEAELVRLRFNEKLLHDEVDLAYGARDAAVKELGALKGSQP